MKTGLKISHKSDLRLWEFSRRYKTSCDYKDLKNRLIIKYTDEAIPGGRCVSFKPRNCKTPAEIVFKQEAKNNYSTYQIIYQGGKL